MSNKYSSDDKMQKLFEGFRRSLNENEDEANEGLNLMKKNPIHKPPEEAPESMLAFHRRTGGKGFPRSAFTSNPVAQAATKRAMALVDEMDNNPELQQDPDFKTIRDNAIMAFRKGDADELEQAVRDFEARKQAKKAEMMQSLE